MTTAPGRAEEHRHLARGVLVSSLGILAKSGRALSLVLFSRLLGTEIFGVYLLAFVIMEVVSKFASLGFDRGLLFLTGTLKGNGREDEIRATVERVTAAGFLASAVAAAVFATGAGLGVRGVILAQVTAGYGALGLAWYYVRRLYPAAPAGVAVRVDWRTLWRAALRLGAGELLTQCCSRIYMDREGSSGRSRRTAGRGGSGAAPAAGFPPRRG